MKNIDTSLLDDLGLTQYQKKTLIALTILGVADAATLCRQGDIPSSKIYIAMEKLSELGLVQVQPTRPKLFSALPSDALANRLIEIAQQRAEQFVTRAAQFKQTLDSLTGHVRGREAFVDLALGAESHVKRHLTYLSGARTRILSYMEQGDLTAIDQTEDSGFPLLRRIGRNADELNIDHRVVFGFSYHTAPQLMEFLNKYRAELKHLTGVRYSGEMGHPFHIVDDEMVILPLDHPFVPEGRFASLLVRDPDLVKDLSAGFEQLWKKAMHDLQEIDFHPRR